MKKLLLILGLCLILLGIPISTAVSINEISSIKKPISMITEKVIPTAEDIPEWALGNFTALWGLNLNGQPQDPLGAIFGYYGDFIFFSLETINIYAI